MQINRIRSVSFHAILFRIVGKVEKIMYFKNCIVYSFWNLLMDCLKYFILVCYFPMTVSPEHFMVIENMVIEEEKIYAWY